MLARNLLLAAINLVLLGVAILLMGMSFGLISSDGIALEIPTPTPLPTPIPPTPVHPTATPTPPIAHADACNGIDPLSDGVLAEYDVHNSRGQVTARIYCDGDDLRYVTFVDGQDRLERVSLFIDGQIRVKVYYSNWQITRRKEFDARGYRVPDYSTISLSNGQISPYRHELVRVSRDK